MRDIVEAHDWKFQIQKPNFEKLIKWNWKEISKNYLWDFSVSSEKVESFLLLLFAKIETKNAIDLFFTQ